MNLEDLMLNLISEALGIAVTVLIIDRLIKRQEEKRWVPTKNYLYAKLFEIMSVFLRAMQIRPVEDNGKEKAYIYGKKSVLGEGSYRGVDLIDIEESVKTSYELDQLANEEIDLKHVSSLKSQIATILDISFTILEPEILELLNDLDESIANFDSFLPDKTKLKTADNISDILLMLSAVISEAINVRTYLEQKADRIISVDQYLKELTGSADETA